MITALLGVLAQLNIAVTGPDSAVVNEEFTVKVTVTSPTLLPPTIVPPSFQGFGLMGSSEITRTESSRRGSHLVREVHYRLVGRIESKITVGSFEARLEGSRTLRSPPFNVVVYRTRPRFKVLGEVHGGAIDPAKAVDITVSGSPDTVFVGQQATYQVAVFVDEALLRQRTARNPTFTPPDLRGTLSYEIPVSSIVMPSRQVGTRLFRPHVYQRAIFPLVPGNHVVPAAMLDYSLPSATMMGREETHSLRADSVVIVARPLPAAGRPADFTGAVGTYRLERSLGGMRLRVGDPFTLRIRVLGTGNIKLIPRPALDIPWADVIEAGERIDLQLDDGRVRGGKQFEWVITPRSGGTQELPSVRYSHFDPTSRRYEVASLPGESIVIVPGSLIAAESTTANAQPVLPIRRQYAGERPEPLWLSKYTLLLAAAAPLPFLVAFLTVASRRRRTRLSARPPRAPTFADVSSQSGEVAVAGARKLFLSSVETRLGIPGGLSATENGFRSALLLSGVSRATTDEAESLMRELDAAVFGGGVASKSVIERAESCLKKIEAEAARPAPGGAPVLPVFLIVFSLLFPAAQQTGNVNTAFDRAVSFYDQGEYENAARQFLEIAQARTRSADAWVNLGVAAWANQDTAVAMVAWQRALRLDPTARDIREHIERMPQSSSRTAGLIPPIPPDYVTIAALVAWVAVWLLALLYVTKRIRSRLPLVLSAAGAIVLVLCAFEINRRVSDRNVAVVTREVISHALPSLESARVMRLSPGEVVILTQNERDWSRVKLDGHTAGWVHQSDLLRVVVE